MDFWEVAILSPPYKSFCYTVPESFPKDFWKVGQRVIVPFKTGFRVGVLLRTTTPDPSLKDIKPIFFPLEASSVLSEEYITFVEEISKHYAVPIAEVLSMILPSGLKRIKGGFLIDKKIVSFKRILSSSKEELSQFAKLFYEKGSTFYEFKNVKSDEENLLVELVDTKIDVPERNKRQKKLIEYLKANGPQNLRSLKKELGIWAKDVVDILSKKGIVKKISLFEKDLLKGKEFLPSGLKLTEEQLSVLDSLVEDLKAGKKGIRLLFGVTGSGKTQIYIHLLKESLKEGKSGLFLVPEVALGYHLYKEVENYFRPWKCYFYHGYLPQREREKIFVEVSNSKEPFVVIGTRSSVFLPYLKWGVIIIDEEHDLSYKQEEKFLYNAKDIAFYLSKRFSSLLLLGSATPDIKSFYSAKQGIFPILYLKNRVNKQLLPEVEIVSINERTKNILTDRAKDALVECLEKGEQAIVLLNRRGYAPILFCTSCKKVLKCKHCSVSLTYHKEKKIVLCHYCGDSNYFPHACPECGSFAYLTLSCGTERVEEQIKQEFGPQIEVLRLDRDSIRTQKDIEKTLTKFSKQKANILLGTQMCSKGYHFPNVTLVIVVDGDVGLNLPDYKASERIFSLLVQVAGRAGRGEKRGRVIIQTRNPDHYFWKHVEKNDYEGFYEDELALRKRFNYPPFSKLALIRISYPKKWQKGKDLLKKLKDILKTAPIKPGIEILGPAPAPISVIKQKIRHHCIIKAQSWSDIRGIYMYLTSNLCVNDPRFKIQLDMDPVQLI